MNKLKRFKKLSALIASTLLTTSLFVGCGNSNVGENGTINFFNVGDYIDEALIRKFEKETGIYKGRFPVNELGGSTYTFEQVTGLYIKGERELFASQWTQEEIRIAEVRVLTIEEKPEERTSQEKHL